MCCLALRVVFLNLLCTSLISASASNGDGRKIYIVYMGSKPKDSSQPHLHHRAMLEEVVGSAFSAESIVYSYKRSFNGFAVKLTEEEAQRMAAKEGVVSVFPSKNYKLQTTRSWDFIGFPRDVPRVPQQESDIIVGVLDTGIWPDSLSFHDQGLGAPPPKWKGICEASANFRCNRKIIGARAYRAEGPPPPTQAWGPIDTSGHGTHVASTVAGSLVDNASLYGFGLGLARGGVPSARIAVYKVCWERGCSDANILAAFDDAIADGVDILSISIGGRRVRPFFENGIAIGAFQAMRNGILVSNSAGNDGPNWYTTGSMAPWMLSVAANTIDRNFAAHVQLGNGNVYQGVAINLFDLGGKQYPLVYAGDVPNIGGGFDSSISRFCDVNSVDRNLVRGKIVLCDSSNVSFPSLNGAVGVVMESTASWHLIGTFPLPASHFNPPSANPIRLYITSNPAPTATIFRSVNVNDTNAPVAAAFSSRGPNTISPNILKPDLSAPGVNILAAWPQNVPISHGHPLSSPYNFASGTSMACPHATAIAAYVKTFSPWWSPAAIKSALMTTASPMDARFSQGAEFAYGSGQINPLKAVNPGLVYNASESDYVEYLCGIPNITRAQLQQITGEDIICTDSNTGRDLDLNYPSFALSMGRGQSLRVFFPRTLTNVEATVSTYRATVYSPPGLNLQFKVDPPALTFHGIGDTKSFTLGVQGWLSATDPATVSASLVWSNGVREVRSPIVLF
ncbi:cucumisin-like [Cucurbita moschata]|uniref:Cucumisin-like n=1 Tax=Cucurbita moschata TaxID=3662 RepID=A0A6J1GX71_CUCMO|nr:cucumisin-like [Cucurbita moschata]